MIDDDFFDAQFPKAVPLLKKMRAQDKEFDQICTDYLELFAELSKQPQAKEVPQSRYIADLAESLSDLRSTIEKRLAAQGVELADRSYNIGES
ncbi:hypothetical protein [Ruegeria sp. 6PALISEP08]|uniref:hypothetical protein n=1 Tax=Ruegeria sp. 6PALISEP08 TaxID=1225660 RepID=UPI00067ED2AF|nr:hypothetical protein [Ruegeria sp. 6PALISEP08]